MTRWAALASGCLAAMILAAPGGLHAGGIDCAKAATAVEKMLCADPVLKKADADVADAFQTALAASTDASAVRASQREWLKKRNACTDAACLAAIHAARQKELAAMAGAAKGSAAAERARLRAMLGWPDSCEQSFQELLSRDAADTAFFGTGVERHALGDGRTLYCVQCDQAAYQSVSVVVLQAKPDGPGALLRFPQYDRSGGKVARTEDAELAGTLEFIPRTEELTVFYKSRGVGDCGSYVRYAFPAEGPSRVKVVEARARECSDRPPRGGMVDPAAWPLVKIP